RAVALRPGLLADRRRPYEALFELYLQQGDPQSAVAVMEQLLAATFLETMAATQIATADLETSARAAARRLTTRQLLMRQEHTQAAAPLGQLLERLGQREVLAFLTARGHLYRVHVLAGKLAVQQLESAQEVRVKRERVEAHPDDPAAAEALGQALWPKPPPGPDLLIVTDASLAGLSFAGLRLNGHYLIEHHVLAYAPSLGFAATLQDRAPTGRGVLVLGDPKGNLPGAAAEARETAHRLEGALALGPAATIARFKEGCRAELLHLAAHSGVGADGAWLELADGSVTTGTVVEERCGPTLVYLASCASAASARKDGAGTLASAFLAAGSRFVIATTRSIDDATAARFTRTLFADGKWDQLPLRLAIAQRGLLKTAPRSAWEPFIVLGP
ncbi:MAG: Tetratricopeptide domain protein, partial [Myxococcaceae bacterium]|nr:Tetratricopeptide domain protein [Myxococcaceae bacterium]